MTMKGIDTMKSNMVQTGRLKRENRMKSQMCLWLALFVVAICALTVPAQISQSLGTLLPGESVNIQFDVAITNTILSNAIALTNQGTLSGSNFADLPTDDPG